eukprot:jgi/Chlat1/6950/Chrsp52S06623
MDPRMLQQSYGSALDSAMEAMDARPVRDPRHGQYSMLASEADMRRFAMMPSYPYPAPPGMMRPAPPLSWRPDYTMPSDPPSSSQAVDPRLLPLTMDMSMVAPNSYLPSLYTSATTPMGGTPLTPAQTADAQLLLQRLASVVKQPPQMQLPSPVYAPSSTLTGSVSGVSAPTVNLGTGAAAGTSTGPVLGGAGAFAAMGATAGNATAGKRKREGTSEVVSGNKAPGKKLQLEKEKLQILEEAFNVQSTPTPERKQELARQLGLLPRQVEVWFQNRRARTLIKQRAQNWEALRKWCDMLTEENCRLRRQVQELRKEQSQWAGAEGNADIDRGAAPSASGHEAGTEDTTQEERRLASPSNHSPPRSSSSTLSPTPCANSDPS